jgi:hypothetical protein
VIVVFAVMNLSLYSAIDRIGLGLAVTLEVLGPLAVALIGSRARIDLLWAVAAGLGVYVLVLPGPSSDYLGIALGCSRRRAGRRTSGSTACSGGGSRDCRRRPSVRRSRRCCTCRSLSCWSPAVIWPVRRSGTRSPRGCSAPSSRGPPI